MASFFCDVSLNSPPGNSASVYGVFTGGQPTHGYRRRLQITFSATGYSQTVTILAAEASGADSTFSDAAAVSGLPYGSVIGWAAVVQYQSGGGWVNSDYTDSGTFRTTAGVTIYNNGAHHPASAYMRRNGAWVPVLSSINKGGTWV